MSCIVIRFFCVTVPSTCCAGYTAHVQIEYQYLLMFLMLASLLCESCNIKPCQSGESYSQMCPVKSELDFIYLFFMMIRFVSYSEINNFMM